VSAECAQAGPTATRIGGRVIGGWVPTGWAPEAQILHDCYLVVAWGSVAHWGRSPGRTSARLFSWILPLTSTGPYRRSSPTPFHQHFPFLCTGRTTAGATFPPPPTMVSQERDSLPRSVVPAHAYAGRVMLSVHSPPSAATRPTGHHPMGVPNHPHSGRNGSSRC
jgi:hypothetical protein